MSDCKHEWDRGECHNCHRFAENLVFSYEKELSKLQKEKEQILKDAKEVCEGLEFYRTNRENEECEHLLRWSFSSDNKKDVGDKFGTTARLCAPAIKRLMEKME